MRKLNTLLVGAGRQGREHLHAILGSDRFILKGIVDPAFTLEEDEQLGDMPIYKSLKDVKDTQYIDCAVLALPHTVYEEAILFCAEHNIHMLKEKPFAMGIEEARLFMQLASKHNVKLMTSFQRRFHPLYQAFSVFLEQIGSISYVNANFTINSKSPNSGWRSEVGSAGGGAVLDMGYHLLDLIIWYFDPPIIHNAFLAKSRGAEYGTDDTGFFSFSVGDIRGTAFVSCVYPYKSEELVVLGTKGSAILRRDRIERYNLKHDLVESLVSETQWRSAMHKQLEYFYEVVVNDQQKYIGSPEFQCTHHVPLMDSINRP